MRWPLLLHTTTCEGVAAAVAVGVVAVLVSVVSFAAVVVAVVEGHIVCDLVMHMGEMKTIASQRY